MVDHALSFGTAAAQYDRLRPTYPRPAVSWAIGTPPPARVVDLAAGTGILTRTLLELGYDVTPVEPDPLMRAQLAASTPGTTALTGTAEEIPLGDGTVDAIIAGTAYHWFDRERAHDEAARVLRPGGTFAATWNNRDNSVAWVNDLGEIAGRWRGDGRGREEEIERISSFGERFVDFERADFTHTVTHTADTLVAMMATRSYYLAGTPAEQAEIEREVRALATEHPDLAGRTEFDLPYRTITYRARRR